MAVTAELEIKVVSDKVLQAERRLNKLEKTGRKTEKSVKGVGKSFGVAAVAAVGLTAATAALWSTFNNIRSAQKLNAMLKTATGSIEGAEEAMSSLSSTAQQMPNTLEEITQAFITLKNLGLDPSEEALLSYGNTAAAMGKGLDQFIEAVADATTNEFERLKEFGIKSKQEGDKVKFTFQGVTTTVGKNAAEIEKFLQGLGNVQFAGAMAEQMDTIDGKLSLLSDAWFQFTTELGKTGLGELVGRIIDKPTEIINEATLNLRAAELDLEKATVADIALLKALDDRFKAKADVITSAFGIGFGKTESGETVFLAPGEREENVAIREKLAELELNKELLDLEKKLTEEVKRQAEGQEALEKFKDQQKFIEGLNEIERAQKAAVDLTVERLEIEERLKEGKFANLDLELEMLDKIAKKEEEAVKKEEALRIAANKKKVEDGANLARDLASIAGIEGEKAFRVNQGIAIAEATMKGALAIQNALATGGPFPSNLGAAALIGVQTLGNIATIKNQSVGSFEQGGFIGGNSFTGDNLSANVNSGEAVLNASQQRNFMRMANGGGSVAPNLTVQINNNVGNARVAARQDADGNIAVDIVEQAVGAVAEQLRSGNGPVALGATQAIRRDRPS